MSTTLILIIGVGVAVLLLGVGLAVSVRQQRALVDSRLDQYVDTPAEERPKKEKNDTALADWLNNQVGKFSWSEGLAKDLAQADLKLRVGEYIAVVAIAIVGCAGVAWFLAGQQLIAAGIGAAVGFFAPKMYVGSQKGNRLIKFDEQLADMLTLTVNGLRAGYSTMQALEAVSKNLPPLISDEFRRVVQEMQFGVDMQRSLENLTRRIPSKDLDLVITAINVQREVGGNLAEILGTISHTIRERVRVKGEIRVMTSQAMVSAKFLSAMPIMVFVALYFLNREYIMLLFSEGGRMIGIPVLVISLGMIGSGYMVMQKIATVEV